MANDFLISSNRNESGPVIGPMPSCQGDVLGRVIVLASISTRRLKQDRRHGTGAYRDSRDPQISVNQSLNLRIHSNLHACDVHILPL
jgi:hypothetical protein